MAYPSLLEYVQTTTPGRKNVLREHNQNTKKGVQLFAKKDRTHLASVDTTTYSHFSVSMRETPLLMGVCSS